MYVSGHLEIEGNEIVDKNADYIKNIVYHTQITS